MDQKKISLNIVEGHIRKGTTSRFWFLFVVVVAFEIRDNLVAFLLKNVVHHIDHGFLKSFKIFFVQVDFVFLVVKLTVFLG